jgi:hypothetical protein
VEVSVVLAVLAVSAVSIVGAVGNRKKYGHFIKRSAYASPSAEALLFCLIILDK